jgi:hypothetical protein
LIALLLAAAASAAALVPASSRAALLLDAATSGFRALLQTAGAHVGSAGPQSMGRDLRRAIGVDLLTDAAPWGLAPLGPRAIVLEAGSIALSAPVKDGKAARKRLDAWLAEAGPSRPTRPAPLKGPAASGNRAAMIDHGRLFIGSGPHATALVNALAHLTAKTSLAKSRPFAAALARATGPAAVFFRGDALLKGGVLALDASKSGLVARGLVLPDGDAPLLTGATASPTDGAPPQDCPGALGCIRADLGSAGRSLLAAAAREYLLYALSSPARDAFDAVLQRASATAGLVAIDFAGLDAYLLGDESDSIWALRFSGAAEASATLPDQIPKGISRTATGISVNAGRPLCLEVSAKTVALSSPCAPAPALRSASDDALNASLDLAVLDRALSKLSPLDVFKGPVAGGAYGLHLLWGSLLRASGPLTITGRPAGAAADIELRLPLH